MSEFNCAVILCDPTERLDVVNVAVVPTMTLLPILVAPSKKLTDAVLVTGIVAVKVTDCLYVDGFTDELSNTSATVSVIVFDVLGL